jgi:hypothetical protein
VRAGLGERGIRERTNRYTTQNDSPWLNSSLTSHNPLLKVQHLHPCLSRLTDTGYRVDFDPEDSYATYATEKSDEKRDLEAARGEYVAVGFVLSLSSHWVGADGVD